MSILQKLHSAKNYLLVFGAVAIIGLSSCEKDDTTTTPTETTIGGAFVTTSGSYWVYENKMTDTNGVLIQEVIGLDSTVASNSYQLDGKTAVDFTTFPSTDNGGYDISDTAKSVETYAKEGNIVFFSTNLLAGNLAPEGLPLDFGDLSNLEKWIIAMQDNPTSWNMLNYPIEIPNLEIPGVSVPLKLTGTVKITGAKLNIENITVNNKTYSAQKFEMNTNINIDVSTLGINVITLTSPIKSHVWIAEGLGIIKKETPASITNTKVNPLFSSLVGGMGIIPGDTKNPGEVSTLIRHKIK